MRFIILLAVLGSALAAPQGSGRIIGGNPTTIERFPYMSNMQLLWYGTIWSTGCGGTLITTTSILSSANCYFGHDIWEWRAVLGSASAYAGISHRIIRITSHPQHTFNPVNNDIAIVHLQTPATLSNNIATASISGPNYVLPDRAPAIYVGWGITSQGGLASAVLHRADVNIINQQECASRYAHLKTLPGHEDFSEVNAGMICAGVLNYGGRDACDGDGGGPLVHGNVVVGIISWGYSCAHPTYPGVNTRVSTYANWIVANA